MNQGLDKLDLISDISQLMSLYLLLKDATNNELEKHLHEQDTKYFEQIVKDLALIKERLGIKDNKK